MITIKTKDSIDCGLFQGPKDLKELSIMNLLLTPGY